MAKIPLSPLRYPGGKTRFVPHLIAWLGETKFLRVIEPFAGGASVSLGLLEAGLVEAAELSDADPLIAAFWQEATENSADFVRRIHAEPITVARWKYWNSADENTLSRSDKAMKTLFKNRTSFSGLIRHGSVLGGVDQDEKIRNGITVKYPVGCRFNKDAIAASITRLGRWYSEGRIVAHHRSYEFAMGNIFPDDLLYLDPPYVEKADQIYGIAFGEAEHRLLAKRVDDLVNVNFAVSYDDLPLIREIYPEENGVRVLTPKWAYGMGKSKTSRELFITNVAGVTGDFS